MAKTTTVDVSSGLTGLIDHDGQFGYLTFNTIAHDCHDEEPQGLAFMLNGFQCPYCGLKYVPVELRIRPKMGEFSKVLASSFLSFQFQIIENFGF